MILRLRLQVVAIIICAILWQPTFAQSKKTSKTTHQDTTIRIIKKSEEPPKPAYQKLSSRDSRKVVTRIKLTDTGNIKPRPTMPKDTVIVVRKGKTKAQLAAEKKAQMDKLMKTNGYLCNCVKMDINVADVLQYETYLNYKFIFKNTCKIDVWVSSKHFRYRPYNSFGKPVKTLRKLSFVTRYDYPDFVRIKPGETYTFKYGDDAFFEYDLKKGQAYKFVFEHRNIGDKSRQEPRKTYLCGQKRTHLVMVK